MGDYPSKKPIIELIQSFFFIFIFLQVKIVLIFSSSFSFFLDLVESGLTATKEILKDELYIHVMKQLIKNKHKYVLNFDPYSDFMTNFEILELE